MIDLLVGVSGLLSVCWSSFEYLVVGSVGEFLLAGLACSNFFPLVGYFEGFFSVEGHVGSRCAYIIFGGLVAAAAMPLVPIRVVGILGSGFGLVSGASSLSLLVWYWFCWHWHW